MWWKIYYWLSIIGLIFMIFGLVQGNNSIIDLIESADLILAVIGLYAFIYKKKVFKATFWLYFFWFNVVFDIAYLVYGLAPNDTVLKNLSFLNTTNMVIPPVYILIISLFNIPFLYVFYKLAQLSKK